MENSVPSPRSGNPIPLPHWTHNVLPFLPSPPEFHLARETWKGRKDHCFRVCVYRTNWKYSESCCYELQNNNSNISWEGKDSRPHTADAATQFFSAECHLCNTIPLCRVSSALMHPKNASYPIPGCEEKCKETPWKRTAWGCSLSEFISQAMRQGSGSAGCPVREGEK